jgi:DNA invertase Pin-like site-specific DNA recombinase
MKENKIYKVGAYARLSKDDGADNESASISTQKAILSDYVKERGWKLVKTYIDDGYSGTNFNRPQFQAMIKDIEAGLIDCVITKDLSRLGRNYLDCGLYLEVFFPENNVRYISINDGVDTNNKSAMDITPFRNILNDMYASDVSMKIKTAYRARFNQGKFMGTTAPYGYIKSPDDKNQLIIDENVAHVVRKIFDLALEGNGIAKIRHWLNNQKNILRPAAYAVEQGFTGFNHHFKDNEENRYIWSENSVRQILRSPVYAGHLTGYKRPAINMKSSKRPSRLPEDWEIVENTHEGIVSQSIFDTVQKLITSRRAKNKSGFDNVFAGIIKCSDCGYQLGAGSANRRKRPELIDCIIYWCGSYTRNGNMSCTSHCIEARDLYNAVLADINYFAQLALCNPSAEKDIQKKLSSLKTNEAKAYEREMRKLTKRLNEIDKLFTALYEDKVMERITERNFTILSEKYEKEQTTVDNRIAEINTELTAKGISDKSATDFISLIKEYQGITELTATIVNALIDKITVSERKENDDGVVEQRITIFYKFVGSLNDFTIPVPKRISYLAEKTCNRCNTLFTPQSNNTQYCTDCRVIVTKENADRGYLIRKAKRQAERLVNAI